MNFLTGQPRQWNGLWGKRCLTVWCTRQPSLHQIHLFASRDNHWLPLYLSMMEKTHAGGPDTLQVDWNQWEVIYLFPPPLINLLLEVCLILKEFKDLVLMTASLWTAQPWCQIFQKWCQNPIPLIRTPSKELRLCNWGSPCILTCGFIKSYLERHFSVTVAQVICNRFQTSTSHQYEAVWKLFQSFSQEKQITSFLQTVVLYFLAFHFPTRKKATGTGNSYLAVLRDPLEYDLFWRLDQRALDLLKKSFFLQWPPQRHKSLFWLLRQVLNHLTLDKHISPQAC